MTNADPGSRTYFEKRDEEVCKGCSAPCCRYLLIPHPAPATFMDLDYLVFVAAFQDVEVVLHRSGQWQILVERDCGLYERETGLCKAHGTSRKPKTCVYFNPYPCWYRRNFETDGPPDIARLDSRALEALLGHVRLDHDGRVVETPPWELTWRIAHGEGLPGGSGARTLGR